jgi:hypothetical protein
MKMDKQENKTKAATEFKSFVYLTLYFTAFLVALTTYKRLVLADHGISIAEYGISVVEAFILAIALQIGAYFRIGSRLNNRPLIIPALYKALCFIVLMLALALMERLARGWWSGMSSADLLKNVLAEKWIILSKGLVILFFALIPLFAFREINRVLGADFLRKLFFRKRSGNDVATTDFDPAIQKP